MIVSIKALGIIASSNYTQNTSHDAFKWANESNPWLNGNPLNLNLYQWPRP